MGFLRALVFLEAIAAVGYWCGEWGGGPHEMGKKERRVPPILDLDPRRGGETRQ